MSNNLGKPEPEVDFSLGLGGPLYQLYLRTFLVKRPLDLYKRRIVVICMIAWLPLLLLSIFSGVAFGGVKIPFIFDIDVHVRFLLSLGLLIFAEVSVHKRIHMVVQQFLKRNLISLDHRPEFNRIIASAIRLRNSIGIEIFLIAFVYTVGHWVSLSYTSLALSTWYASKVNDIVDLTAAGYWYAFISLPLFQFILVRWYYRMGIWYRFLWQMSRLPMQLNSLHPDRTAGLGFLEYSIFAFAPLLIAHTVLLAGVILNRIVHAGAVLTVFQTEIFSILMFLVFLPLLPLVFFLPTLLRTKKVGTLEYGVVATTYVNDFRKKWIRSVPQNSNNMLGTSDIQSLADLANSFQVSSAMRILPFGKTSMIAIIVVISLPLMPLVLTMFPLEEIISRAIKIIF